MHKRAFGYKKKGGFVPSNSSNSATGPKKALKCVGTFSNYFFISAHSQMQNFYPALNFRADGEGARDGVRVEYGMRW